MQISDIENTARLIAEFIRGAVNMLEHLKNL